MCGIIDTLVSVITDVGLTAVGAPELIPAANAAESFGEGLASGEGVGKAAIGGLESGGESLAGQELAGAVGIGSGNSFVNDALGIDLSPSATGLPDLGSSIGLGSSGNTDANATTSGNPASGGTTAEGGAPNLTGTTSTATPATGGVISPTGADAASAQTVGTQLNASGLTDLSQPTTDLGTISAPDTAPTTPVDTASLGPVGSSTDTSNIGPVNATPSISTPTGANLSTPGGVDLSGGLAPQTPTPTPSAADTAFLNGQAAPSAAPNIGQGPTLAAGAAATSTPATQTPGFLTNLESGNVSGAVGNIGTALEKNPGVDLAGLFAGYEALKGPAPLSSSGQALQAQGNTLNTTANADLAAANSGTLTAPQQATITQYIQGATNQLYQQLASQGISNPQGSTGFTQGLQQIQQQATAMAQSYIQQSFSNAMSAAGQAGSDLSAAAQEQTSSDNAYTTALSSAVASIGGAYTLGGMNIKTQPATGA